MFVLIVIGHLDGCIFWVIDRYLEGNRRWVVVNKLMDKDVSFATQYLTSYLTAVKSLVLKLREVENNIESIYVIFEFIAGIVAYGTVFGTIHKIVELLDKQAVKTHAQEQHVFQVDMLKKYMKEKRFKPELQRMVFEHKLLQFRRSEGLNYERLFDDVPKRVLQEIKDHMYLDMIQKVPIFADADINFRKAIVLKIKV